LSKANQLSKRQLLNPVTKFDEFETPAHCIMLVNVMAMKHHLMNVEILYLVDNRYSKSSRVLILDIQLYSFELILYKYFEYSK